MDNLAKGHPDIVESYMELRRDLSLAFALIEFANRIDLPDEGVLHPVIMALQGATSDFVSWSNDTLFSPIIKSSLTRTHIT
ncbi:hypothetical protein BDR04DRAFT_871161 [Suillus decipiens]|nr:hypothetical protein BDR04DRAFT_871161 [Suillus decipiens]